MLQRLIERIARLPGWFVPPEVAGEDPEGAMRGRLLIAGVITMFLLHGIVLIEFFLLETRSRVTEVSMVSLEIMYFAIPWILRWSRSTKAAGTLTIFTLLAFLTFVSYDNGGFNPVTLPWICTVPLIATFFVGTRLGLISLGAIIVQLVTLHKMEEANYPFPQPALPETVDYFMLISGITASGFVALLGGLYERSRRSAMQLAVQRHAELEALNEKLRQLWDEARAGSNAKTEFIANVSHELRTPMNGVIGMAGLLLDTNLTSEQRDYAETIVGSAQSLLLLINELLDTAKIEAGKLELHVTDFDLPQCIEDTMGLLAERAHNKDLELAYLIGSDVPTWVEGDRVRLRQVITNLLGNAIKFTERGEVTLIVKVERPGDLTSPVRFEVRDTGVGISEDMKAKLFEPFVQADTSMTRRYGGTGLGLTIAKNLVELMGGKIGVDSVQGEGSTFWFTVTFENQWSGREDSLSLVSLMLGRRALVVDDSVNTRKMVTQQLQSLGFSVDTASSGRDALIKLEDAGHPPAIVIADVAMPEMDGIALVRAMKANPALAPIPVVLLSPLSRAGRRKEALALGAAAYVAKPPRRLQLADRIAAALAQRPAEETLPSTSVPQVMYAPDVKSRILLVEDNEVSAKVGVRQLQKLGYEVDAASSGREAVAMVSRTDYDLVLMDCHMPDVDGFEATRQIRRLEGESKRTVIIAMTASAMVGDRERCLLAGMDDFLTKPVRIEELREILFRWMAQVPAPSSSTPELTPASAPAAPAVVPEVVGAPPAAQASDSVSVDLAAIERLRALVSKDEPNLLKELIDIFLRDARASCSQLHEAAQRHDRQTIEYQAHKLVSGCANLGAKRMARLCRELEEEAKKEQSREFAPYVEQIEQEFAVVCKTFAEQRVLGA